MTRPLLSLALLLSLSGVAGAQTTALAKINARLIADGWVPIDSAPRDGSDMFVVFSDYGGGSAWFDPSVNQWREGWSCFAGPKDIIPEPLFYNPWAVHSYVDCKVIPTS